MFLLHRHSASLLDGGDFVAVRFQVRSKTVVYMAEVSLNSLGLENVPAFETFVMHYSNENKEE